MTGTTTSVFHKHRVGICVGISSYRAFFGILLSALGIVLCLAKSQAQITITQPSANARIIAQGQFLIQWAGTSPNDTVRIEFSADNGLTWQLVTNTATGNQHLWNPVPVIVSDQCILRIVTGVRNDANPFILRNTFKIFYGSNRAERNARSRFATFSPDGTRILAFASNFNPNNANDSLQNYQVQVWDAQSGRLLSILSSYLTNTRAFSQQRWQWNDNTAPLLKHWWSPDSRRIISPISTDTSFGIFNARTTDGQPETLVNIPRFGVQRAIRQLRWMRNGREILADILYRGLNSDSTFIAIVRFNPDNGAVLGAETFGVNVLSGTEIISFAGYSNDGTRFLRTYQDRSTREITRLTIHDTFDEQRIISTLRPPQGYRWRQYTGAAYTGLWSPNDSLLAMVSEPNLANTDLSNVPETIVLTTWNGNIFRRIPARPTPEPIVWSSDSRQLLLWNGQDDNARDVYDVFRGSINTLLRFNNLSSSQFPSAGAFNLNPYNIAWSNDMKRIAAYTRPFNPNAPELGIWDAEQGCLLQTVRLPLLPSAEANIPMAERLRWTGTVSWNNDDSQILLQNFFNDTTLVISVPRQLSPCRSGSSGSEFIIRTRSDFVVQEVSTFPAVICVTASTLRVPIRNVSQVAQSVRASLVNVDETLNPVRDFRILEGENYQLQAGESKDVIVQFTPTFFGRKTANLTFNLGPSFSPQRTLLVAVKDTLDITPKQPVIDFGLIPANSSTTTTITLRNTGTTDIIWNTNATFSANRFFWVESFTPNVVAVNQESQAVIRFAGRSLVGQITDSLSLLQCLNQTFPLRIQGRVLPETGLIQTNDSLTFGRLVCGSNTEATITIRNIGGRRLDIFSGIINNAEFRVINSPFPFSLAPLESRTIRVLYEPRREGRAQGLLTIRSNDPDRGSINLPISAEKQSLQYAFSENVLEFIDVPENSQSVQSTLFTNLTNQSAFIPNLPLAITPDIVLERVSTNPITPNNSAEMIFRFRGRSERIEFSTSGVIPVSDICSTQVPIQFNIRVGEPRPRLTLPVALAFDTVACSTSSEATITLRNTGGRVLQIDSLFIDSRSGVPDRHFQLIDIVPSTLPILLQPQNGAGTNTAQSTFPVRIRFQPTTTGNYEVFMRVVSNDRSTTPTGIQRTLLLGRRDTIGFELNRQTLNFVTTTEQTPLTQIITITNTGTAPLQWGVFPRRMNEFLSIERIDPPETPPNGISQVTVRFVGGAFGTNTVASVTLAPQQCPRIAQSFTLRAFVGRQAAIDAPSSINRQFICEDEQRFVIPVRNIGSDVLTINQVQAITSLENIRFTSIPTTIPVNGTDSIRGLLLSRNEGVFSTRIQILSNAGNQPVQDIASTFRKDSLGFRFVPARADFGNLAEQTSATRQVVLENIGNRAQILTIPTQVGIFRIDGQMLSSPITLPIRSTLPLTIRFPSSTGGTYSGEIRLQDSCGRITILPITANVLAGQMALPERIALGQGQEAVVPLRILERRGIIAGTPVSFRVRVGNASMLEIRSPMPTSSSILNGARILTFSATVPSGNDTTPLLQLGLRGLLGNDTLTTITIDSVRIGGVAIRGSESRFQALGLNNSSGRPRLYYTSPVIIRTAAPNPAQDGISLTLEALEDAPSHVFLVDVLGKKTLLGEYTFSQGTHIVPFTLSNLPSGVYTLEVLTNGHSRTTTRIHLLR